jgi:hypothetical protein
MFTFREIFYNEKLCGGFATGNARQVSAKRGRDLKPCPDADNCCGASRFHAITAAFEPSGGRIDGSGYLIAVGIHNISNQI